MIKRTVTTFETIAETYGRDKGGNLVANEVARFTWQGGTKPNDGQARKAYVVQYGKPLRRAVKLFHIVKSVEVWGMEVADFMKYAHKLSDKEIGDDSDE